ncbi:MAG: extracellular solute-binding protein [Muricomes sp.]|nr:extracellular solute-binding protein [Muricomes sp.]
MGNVKIKDIAEAAGVSPATVSCCLTGTRNVKPETKARIMETIERLRYIPNSSARNLRCNSSSHVGIVLTGMDESFYANVLIGISSALSSSELSLRVAFSHNSPETECTIIDDFISQNISGLILVTCQPENTAFFESRIEHYQIPAVFLDRTPHSLKTNYVGFDNFKTISYFMDILLRNHYQKIALFCGPTHFSSEADCIHAYQHHMSRFHPQLKELIFPTNASKEDAFKNAFISLNEQNMQAIICSSEAIATGVSTAASLLGLDTEKDLLILSLAGENWCLPVQSHGMVYSSKSAYKMGLQAGRLLMQAMQDESHSQAVSTILTDSILSQLTSETIRQAPPLIQNPHSQPNSVLRIMLTDLNSANSITILSKQFERLENVKIEYEFVTQKDVLKSIIADSKLPRPRFDIYMYDIPWSHYLAQNRLIEDITEYIKTSPFHEGNFFSHNLNNCRVGNSYFGVPVVGGAQIMFYRKDLFENKTLQKRYKELYKTSLKPPKTWKQFLQTARFFTKKYNSGSPTPYGTSLAGIDSLTLAPELFARILSCGGSVWDSHCRVSLNSPENLQAFCIVQETIRYCENSPFETSIAKTVQDFCTGKTAILITYIERATEITNALTHNMIGSVDYTTVPGYVPVSIGWNFGISPYTENLDVIYHYLNWLGDRDVNNYLTILDGQTAHMEPYHNPEFIRLYPWMKYTENSFKYCRNRIQVYKKNAMIIPQNEIDNLLYLILMDIEMNDYTVEDALYKAQTEGKELLKKYGYYPTPKLH